MNYIRGESGRIMSPAKRSHSHNHARRQSEALRLIESPVLLAEIKDEHARAHAVIRMQHSLSKKSRRAGEGCSVRMTGIADGRISRKLELMFCEYCGGNPMKYLQHMRLKNALTLLVHQNLSMAVASRRSSFEEDACFTAFSAPPMALRLASPERISGSSGRLPRHCFLPHNLII